MVKVLLFAGLAEACGARSLEIMTELPAPVAAVRAAAERAHSSLRGRRYAVAVEARWAADQDLIREGDEVAFLPPVSGG